MISSFIFGVLFNVFMLILGYSREFSLMAGLVMTAVMMLSEILRTLEAIRANQTR